MLQFRKNTLDLRIRDRALELAIMVRGIDKEDDAITTCRAELYEDYLRGAPTNPSRLARALMASASPRAARNEIKL